MVYASSPFIHPDTTSNRIKIERNGSLIKAFANGHLLTSISENSYTGSRHVGLIVTAYDQPNMDARFDNFSINPVICGSDIAGMSGANAEILGFEMGESGIFDLLMQRELNRLP
jgi:hypothetical protein